MWLNKQVTFSTAKLLKEKGFDEIVRGRYTVTHWNSAFKIGDLFYSDYPINDHCAYAPTIAEVVMWCFNKYKYSIEYSMNIPESGEYDGCYVFNGLIKGSEDYKLKIFYTSKDYPTIEKALETAIEYTLNNLI